MTVAIPLDTRAIRILWPPTPGTAGRPVSGAATAPRLSGATEYQITLPQRTLGPYKAKYFVGKVVFGGAAKLKAPMINGGAPAQNQIGLDIGRSTDGNTAVTAKYERALNDALTAEFSAEISNENFSQISKHIANGDWRAAAYEMFCVKIKGGFPLTETSKVDFEFDMAPDDDLCFFGVTAKLVVAVPLDGIAGLPRGYSIEVEAPVTFRFGLSTEGWRWVARKIGGPAVRSAVARLGQTAAANALRTFLAAAGVYAIVVVGGVAGSLGLMYLTSELIASAKASGQRLGMLSGYCTGYIGYFQLGHTNDQSTLYRVARYKTHELGFNDAHRACKFNSQQIVERTLINHFGSSQTFWNWATGGRGTSRVGTTVDSATELNNMSMTMARFLTDEIETISAYLGAARVGGFIQQVDHKTRR